MYHKHFSEEQTHLKDKPRKLTPKEAKKAREKEWEDYDKHKGYIS